MPTQRRKAIGRHGRGCSSARPSRPLRDTGLHERILRALRAASKRGIAMRQLERAARLKPIETAALQGLVDELMRAGVVVERRGRLVLGSRAGLKVGRLSAHPDGYAFVSTDDPDEDDYYVPRAGVRPAMHGDRVVVSIRPAGRHRRGGARVLTVLEHQLERLTGIYRSTRQGGRLQPYEERLPYVVHIAARDSMDARDGDAVVAAITRYPTPNSDLQAEVKAVLGPAEDPRVQTDVVIASHDLPFRFPAAVVAEAEAVARQAAAEDVAKREDLRAMTIFTIDGENARDFDDAVGLQELPDRFRLWVSIADVAHYVRAGGILDHEAAARGCSVYFPDRVLPMLPEALSNGICSLNPNVDRPTKTVILDFDARGRVQRSRFCDSVIRSTARLTYTEVRQILSDHDQRTRRHYAGLVGVLEGMQRLCLLLRERRRQRGSIDFDLPEADVVLDLTGHPEAIVRAERHVGHEIIEEFMLAANEAVARYLMRHELPLLHRVHEAPNEDSIFELRRFLAGFGLQLPATAARSPADFQAVLDAVAGKPEARLVHTILLRSMQQARYASEALGHFGLATDAYTHFTSPIRRYPDLVVHRILAEAMTAPVSAGRKAEIAAELPAIAEHSSRRERIAVEAERDVIELKKVQFMQDKIGMTFDGFISGVQPFGFFVELAEYFVEGLVHIVSLQDDEYVFAERSHLLRGRRSGRIFRLGDPVRVRVHSVDCLRRRIDFGLEESDATETSRRARRT